MPTYVYECSKCNDQFEIEQRITEEALETCPCGSTGTVKRIIQPVGIMFKGSGFHINDYSTKAAAEKSEQPKAEAKVDSNSDTKSDTKADTSPASEPTHAATPSPVPTSDGP